MVDGDLTQDLFIQVTGHPEVVDRNRRPSWKPMENPSKRDVSINGVITMETRRKAEERKEEERWRKLYPEIKKCVIVIARQSLDRLNALKLKQEKNGERREEEGGGRWSSGDPEPRPDWMEPVEQDESGGGGEVRFTRSVKKVGVKVWPEPRPR